MVRRLLAGLSIVLAGTTGAWAADGPDFTVVPGERFGAVRSTSDRASLDDAFGAPNVRDEDVYLGEGFCVPGTVVFPESPDRLEVAWQDPEQTRVAFVRLRGEASRWQTEDGVALGTTLARLEELKGAPLEFSGFGWDYGGGLTWETETGTLGLRLVEPLTYPDDVQSDPRLGEIMGDRMVRSDHPLVSGMDIRVSELAISWGNPWDERECQ